MHAITRTAVAAVLVVGTGCGGGANGPTGPSQPATVTISGRVLETLTGTPIPGATVTIGGRAITTAADGSWSLDGQSADATLTADISASGYLTRNTRTRTDDGRSAIAIDLIRNAAPFSLSFYRDIARNGYDSATLEPLRRWTTDPNIYVDTRNGQGGTLTAQELAAIRTHAAYSIETVSGGALRLASFESGPSARGAVQGWINVSIYSDPTSSACGTAIVGTNPGTVTFNYGRCVVECSGLQIAISTIRHEFGHAMGLWHHDRLASMMGRTRPAGTCAAPAAFTSEERYHARMLYQRTPGNLDIDRDGTSTTLATAATTAGHAVSCYQ